MAEPARPLVLRARECSPFEPQQAARPAPTQHRPVGSAEVLGLEDHVAFPMYLAVLDALTEMMHPELFRKSEKTEDK